MDSHLTTPNSKSQTQKFSHTRSSTLGHHSLKSLRISPKLSTLTTQNESIRLQYQLDLLTSENKHLRCKLKQSEDFFHKELKTRDQVIFSMSSMMQDRESQFKKLLESQETEKNSIIGQQESEKSSLKKKIQSLKSKLQDFDGFKAVQKLETEIAHLRNILRMTEKENRELLKRVEITDEALSRKKMLQEKQDWDEICFEVGVLADGLSKLRSVLGKMVKGDCSLEVMLRTLPREREEVTRRNLIEVVREAVVVTKGIQEFCVDVYADRCGELCFVQ